MPHFDYSSTGAYFVTICVHERELVLGEEVDDEVRLSGMGELVDATWRGLSDRFPSVGRDAFVVMPNHVHGILWLTDDPVGAGIAPPVRIAPPDSVDVSAGGAPGDLRRPSLGQVVGAFKSISTVQVNRPLDSPGRPLWQRNYYEHVIRDEKALHRIRQYISENPARWDQDPENPRVPAPRITS